MCRAGGLEMTSSSAALCGEQEGDSLCPDRSISNQIKYWPWRGRSWSRGKTSVD